MYFDELAFARLLLAKKNCERIVAEVVCVCVAEHSAMHILDVIA
jgi:hypothetical protein